MMYKADAMFDSLASTAPALRVVLLCLALLLAPGLPLVASAPAEPESGLTLDFKEADIHALIKYISEATGRNFITDPSVKGKVTVYSPIKISPDEAFETFVSILRVQGYAVQKSGTAYKIVPLKEGLGQGEEASVGRSMGGETETIATQIVPLKVGVASELAKILPSLLGKDYALSAYTPSNTLAITAPATNVAKAMAFLEQVESSNMTGRASTIGLQYGDAKTLAATLSKILKSRDEEFSKKGRPTVSLVLADERTNSLLVYGDPESLNIARNTIGSLDIPTPKGKGDVHLISLSNAKAEDLALVINTLVERQRASGTDEQKPDTVLSKDIKVVADKSTNSLVVTARPDEFEALSNIVSKLDVVRKQVFIEALIMEVNSEASFAFGINWAAAGEVGDVNLIGGVSLNGGAVSLGSNKMASLPSGISIGAILKDAFTVGNTTYNIQSILNAVKGNTDVEVLSTPQLLTLDNEEASVEVVDNIPFTKESTTRNDNDFTTQSMDYKDVGVKLKITPRISDDGSLRLEVEQEVSRVTQGLITLTNGEQLVAPTTRKRLVKTTILLQDGQTAVIGGLLDDQKSYNQSEVPGLGSIPVLGWLFKSRSKDTSRTNLFIFITPKVIRSAGDSLDLTQSKQLVLHETSVGKDGLGLPIMSKPKLLKPVFVN
ncbi:MAG TPA: type II secretion system secretin GspD [Candidatus Bilophila faecipullorum]|uniref:Type II secretion system secretin GspD n=2 Tax=Bilophila TaxID=35832 RepID=A0A9D1R0S5_9BACT|nr:type II secretion system secretin GspD [uncultured Bilophila sp.]HIW78834.1 type II secretion system secretin GspD [Candidatus Bilophila faecipullorum]